MFLLHSLLEAHKFSNKQQKSLISQDSLIQGIKAIGTHRDGNFKDFEKDQWTVQGPAMNFWNMKEVSDGVFAAFPPNIQIPFTTTGTGLNLIQSHFQKTHLNILSKPLAQVRYHNSIEQLPSLISPLDKQQQLIPETLPIFYISDFLKGIQKAFQIPADSDVSRTTHFFHFFNSLFPKEKAFLHPGYWLQFGLGSSSSRIQGTIS